jgi:hypothetical protein
MKKMIGGLMLLGAFAFSNAQTISFDKTTIDYGTIPVNADGYRVFTFKNTGDKPLILSNVQPGCGCTASEWSKDPILPGKTGQIKAHYNTAIAAPFKKSIDVFSNDPANGRVVLYIQGTVDANAKAEEAKPTAVSAAPTKVEAAKKAK